MIQAVHYVTTSCTLQAVHYTNMVVNKHWP